MRTAIVSDLHLGTQFGEDLLRDGEIRSVLLDALADADRLVLLGDAVELRERPLPRALELCRPFFEELGARMAGREVVLVPGNHDHRLAEPLLEAAVEEDDGPLGLERRAGAAGEGPTAKIAAWLGDTALGIAYPGLWLRDDVYATHGHYMDCHMSLPRMECLAVATVMRAFGQIPEAAAPADYERVLRPVYGFSFGMAQTGMAERAHRPSERAWRAISGRDRPRGRLRRGAIKTTVDYGIPAGIWGLNRLLRSDFEPVLTAPAISRSGIEAAVEMSSRLGLGAVDLITGHTHRAGPREDDAPWPLRDGGRLHNTGSWVFSSAFHHPGTPPGPYWPGTITWVEDSGPPHRERLLEDRPLEELKAIVARSATSAAAI